jgi:hypothetical protein
MLSATEVKPLVGTLSTPVAVKVIDPPAGIGVAGTPPVPSLVSTILSSATSWYSLPASLADGLTR